MILPGSPVSFVPASPSTRPRKCETVVTFRLPTQTVMVRPENVSIVGPGGPTADRISWLGRVVDSIYRGARRSVVVDVAGKRFQVEAPALQHVTTGDDVTLLVEPGGAWAFRPDRPAADR